LVTCPFPSETATRAASHTFFRNRPTNRQGPETAPRGPPSSMRVGSR
jgi:hypothetical protein